MVSITIFITICCGKIRRVNGVRSLISSLSGRELLPIELCDRYFSVYNFISLKFVTNIISPKRNIWKKFEVGYFETFRNVSLHEMFQKCWCNTPKNITKNYPQTHPKICNHIILIPDFQYYTENNLELFFTRQTIGPRDRRAPTLIKSLSYYLLKWLNM